MTNVSFLLKEPNATKPTPVFAFLSFDGKRVKVYTGLSILPKQSLKAEQRAQVRGYADNGQAERRTGASRGATAGLLPGAWAKGLLPSTEVLRAAILPEQAVVTVPLKAGPTFWGYFDEFTLPRAPRRRLAQLRPTPP
jgi:hypothetical protein